MQPQTQPLQTLPEPHTEFVFTVTGGGWAVFGLLALVALVAAAVRWRRRRDRGR